MLANSPFILLLIIFLAPFAHSDEPTIFDLKKPIRLSDSDPIYRDYYINGGKEKGIVKGMVIPVQRKVTLYDPYQNRSPGELVVPVARVKIIHSQKGVSVARLHSSMDVRKQPHLDEQFIMLGDKLLMAEAKMDRRKTASVSSQSRGLARSKSSPVPKLEIKAGELSKVNNLPTESE